MRGSVAMTCDTSPCLAPTSPPGGGDRIHAGPCAPISRDRIVRPGLLLLPMLRDHGGGDRLSAGSTPCGSPSPMRSSPAGVRCLHWVGWENFRYVLTDPDFGEAFWRTLYFTIVSVVIEIVLGVLVALLLDREFYRARHRARADRAALGAAHHRQRHDVAADLQSGVRQPERAAEPVRPDRQLPLLARRSGLRR